MFKEYALADLSRHREGKVGLRWRTESEVVSGKGHFACGAIGEKKCDSTSALHSYELNFKYVEHGERRNELVKVRLCHRCARKLPGSPRSVNEEKSKTRRKDDNREPKSSGKKRAREERAAAPEVPSSDPSAAGASEVPPVVSSLEAAETSTSAELASTWSSGAPKQRTEEDEMESYLQSMFP